MTDAARPVCVLVGALGGEGGGVLTDWIVSAATQADLPVQSTSIPGVAQRTGATTYYVEIHPVATGALGGRQPLMALYPGPGNVDLVLASELLEAGRAMELGFVDPERTVLVASTHRVYAVVEKSATGDGRYDGARVLAAARTLAARAVLLDVAAVARASESPLNAVLLGAMAATGVLPLDAEALENAIRTSGKAVAANLRGFRAGLECVTRDASAPPEQPAPDASAAPGPSASDLPPGFAGLLAALPEPVRDVAGEGASLAHDYLDGDYAGLYLRRLAIVSARDHDAGGAAYEHVLTRECARRLALWMCYEDVVRVADLKSRPGRLARIRREQGAGPRDLLRVTEYLKPGVEEICAVAPPALARALRALAGRADRRASLRIATHTVLGHLLLRALAGLRRWRRRSERFAHEHAFIDWWLAAIRTAAARSYALGCEVVECAALHRGYGDTFERGQSDLRRIVDAVLLPALAGGDADEAAEALRRARRAALADPRGRALDAVLVAPPARRSTPAAHAIDPGATT